MWLHQSYASLLCSKTNGFIPSSCWKIAQVILSNGGIWNICIKFWGDWFQGININLQVRDLDIEVINFWVAIQLQTISHIGSSLVMTQPAFSFWLSPHEKRRVNTAILSEKGLEMINYTTSWAQHSGCIPVQVCSLNLIPQLKY